MSDVQAWVRRMEPGASLRAETGGWNGLTGSATGLASGRAGYPARVYAVLRDYQEHHPKILPPAFPDFRIEKRGVGAGTVVAFTMSAGGRPRSFQSRIEEPEPGRVLREVDLASTAVTTFTVTLERSRSRVRIVTSWQGAGGFGGLKERLFAPWFLRKLYDSELERLERYVREHGTTS